METVSIGQVIGQHHQKTLQQHRQHTTALSNRLSERQMTEENEFLKLFPSAEKLIGFFAPSYWSYALQHTAESLCAPAVTLARIDNLYHVEGTATTLIKNQIVGVYSVSTAREIYDTRAADLSTSLFYGRYCHTCNPYDLLQYGARYITDYKGSYAAFDFSDFLLQYGKKYLPWKRSIIKPEQPEQQQTKGITLAEMVYKWVADGRTDDDFREGGLYQSGIINDAMIAAARAEYQKAADGAVF